MKKITCIFLVTLIAVCLSVSAFAATSYNSDGAVAIYDASDAQDGAGVWADKSGNGNDMTVPTDGGCGFANGAYVNAARKIYFPENVKNALLGNEWTLEIALGDTELTGKDFATFVNSANDAFALFFRVGGEYLEFKGVGNDTSIDRPKKEISSYDELDGATVSVSYKVGGECVLYLNGERFSAKNVNVAITPDNLYFGHDNETRSHTTEYESIRVYSKALSADDIAENYAVDNAVGADDEENPETGDMFAVIAFVPFLALTAACYAAKKRV